MIAGRSGLNFSEEVRNTKPCRGVVVFNRSTPHPCLADLDLALRGQLLGKQHDRSPAPRPRRAAAPGRGCRCRRAASCRRVPTCCLRNRSRSFSEAPFSATGSLSFSTERSSTCIAGGVRRCRSSKVNISDLMRSAASRLRSSSAARKRRLGLAVQVVEDLRHHLVRVAPRAAREVGHELGAQRAFDAVQHVLLHAFHAQHAHDHFHGERIRQQRQHARGMFRRAPWTAPPRPSAGIRSSDSSPAPLSLTLPSLSHIVRPAGPRISSMICDGAVARQRSFAAGVRCFRSCRSGCRRCPCSSAKSTHSRSTTSARTEPSCAIAAEMSLISSSCIMPNSREH